MTRMLLLLVLITGHLNVIQFHSRAFLPSFPTLYLIIYVAVV